MATATARPPFVLTGATGTGKTAVALELAARIGGAIVCADSRQLYRGLDVATGKPTPEERARLPHHGFDLLAPTERASAGEFARATKPVLTALATAGTPALLVGGSGLYLRALHAGLAEVPTIPDEVRARVRDRLAQDGPEALHAELAALDAPLAGRLSPRDGQRVARGLEVHLATGRPLSAWHADRTVDPEPWFWVALERRRPELTAALATRAREFFANGLVAEVEGLLAQGVPADAAGFDALGYREAIEVALGGRSRASAEESLTRHTLQYAKRQGTWLRGEARRVEIVFRTLLPHESPGQVARELADAYARFASTGAARGVRVGVSG
jgi:tRNA dimethylallyltransferase